MGATENNHLEQRIIETAQQLFIEKGFTETSMSDRQNVPSGIQ